MDSPTQMAYQSLLREVHLLVDKFEQLRPFIRGALQFPRDQVFSLWRAVSALALPVNEAQSQLLAEAVTRDNATHDSMQKLYSEGFVPEIGRVHSADMAESVLAENLAVIFVLNGELPKETADRGQSTGYAPQMCQELRNAHPAALVAWSLYFHASSWTKMPDWWFMAFFSTSIVNN